MSQENNFEVGDVVGFSTRHCGWGYVQGIVDEITPDSTYVNVGCKKAYHVFSFPLDELGELNLIVGKQAEDIIDRYEREPVEEKAII